MKKTFYSVKYAIWGADHTSTAWFDNKTDADRFANHDYRDNPIAHTYSRPESITAAEKRVQDTIEYDL